jgi:diguanylate cyclase (GGDEF)-like protein
MIDKSGQCAAFFLAVNHTPLSCAGIFGVVFKPDGACEMKAAAAARMWWAALRQRSLAPAGSVLSTAASQVSSYVLMAVAAAMVVCAVIGFTVTLRADRHVSSEQHAALQLVLDDMQYVASEGGAFGDGQLAVIARRAGLKDLRFDADDSAIGGREAQSIHDGRGRIVGWFSWAPDRALIGAVIWLWGITGALGVVLGVSASLAGGLILRLARRLSASLRTIRKLTSEDVLTGLPNHRVMIEKLNTALERRASGIVALVLIDLDGFREVNDTHGRSGGDALMKHVANRLAAGLPEGAQFGRFEDDEFAVILTGDDTRATAALAETLRASLSQPVFMEQNWQITAGIGIAQAPADGNTAEELSRRADLALRAAKRDGRSAVRTFEPQIETEYTDRNFIRRELETVIASGSLELHYQPVVAAAGGSVLGVEALCRWNHPARGAIAPSVFIPLAEQSGLMPQLGEFVLRRALSEAARWPSLTVAVNLSPLQIRDPKIVDLVATVMRENGIAPSRIVLEVTESVLIDDPQATLQRLEALRALGVHVALDDFGTGYSSLSYLQKFPFNQLKIDRAFVASLGTTGNAGAIIQSIVTLGHALGMKVLAEGVETDEQRVLLRLAGCDEMQGFLFSKPRPAEAIDKLVMKATAGRAAPKQVAAAR